MTASKMNPSIDIPAHLISLAKANTEVQVLWLYGSMALWLYGSMALWLYGSQSKGTAGPNSDWDLAVAFDPVKLTGPFGSILENRLRPELLALDWQRALGLAEGKISIIDINQAPIPLAFAVVDANHLLYCRDEGRRLGEEARIMSQMEINYTHRPLSISNKEKSI